MEINSTEKELIRSILIEVNDTQRIIQDLLLNVDTHREETLQASMQLTKVAAIMEVLIMLAQPTEEVL